jgi:hypothetical protein
MQPDTLAFEDGAEWLGFAAGFDAEADLLAVGSPGEEGGTVRIYERDQGGWILRQRLLPERTGTDDFGSVVVLSGARMAVSAPSYQSCDTNPTDCQNHGYVIVFEQDGDTWRQVAKLQANDATPFQAFGGSLAFHGSQLLVGAVGDGVCGSVSNDIDCRDTGAVYVFEKQAGEWKQVDKLKPARAGGGDTVGFALAVEGDRLIVGAPGRAGCATGVGEQAPWDTCGHAGALHVYENVQGQWQERDLVQFRRDVMPSFNGRSIRIANDTIFVAGIAGGFCPGTDGANCRLDGIVLVLERGAHGWQQTSVIESSLEGLRTFALAFDAKDTELAVTAAHRPPGASFDHQTIELFRRVDGAWTRTGELTPHPVPFSRSINILSLRIEQAGILFSTGHAVGCTTNAPSCLARGTIVTWPFTAPVTSAE